MTAAHVKGLTVAHHRRPLEFLAVIPFSSLASLELTGSAAVACDSRGQGDRELRPRAGDQCDSLVGEAIARRGPSEGPMGSSDATAADGCLWAIPRVRVRTTLTGAAELSEHPDAPDGSEARVRAQPGRAARGVPRFTRKRARKREPVARGRQQARGAGSPRPTGVAERRDAVRLFPP